MKKNNLLLRIVLGMPIFLSIGCEGDGADHDAGLVIDANQLCSEATAPAVPENPVPANEATDVGHTRTGIDWDDAEGATSYDVYVDGFTCPPPVYPDPAFQNVTDSELTGLSLLSEMTYCWQVVTVDENGCATAGPVWSFTTACADEVPGPPEVTSSLSAAYPNGTTEGFYTLTFSELVNKVGNALTFTPDNGGSGTRGKTDRLSDTEFRVNFSGVDDGESYTLTVGTAVRDSCGRHLSAPVEITITIKNP